MHGCGCFGHCHCYWPRGHWCSCCGCWHYGRYTCQPPVLVVPPIVVRPVSQPRPAVNLGQAIRQGREALGVK